MGKRIRLSRQTAALQEGMVKAVIKTFGFAAAYTFILLALSVGFAVITTGLP
jgi:hypothetical protein